MPLLFCLQCKVCTPIETDKFMVRCSTCLDILLVPPKKGFYYAYSPCRYNTIIKIPTIYSCTCHHATYTIDEDIPPNIFNGVKVHAVDNHSLVLERALRKHFPGPKTLDEEISTAKQRCNILLTKKYGMQNEEAEEHKAVNRDLTKAQKEIERLVRICEEHNMTMMKESMAAMTNQMKRL